jgi:hypothetical protein
MIDVNRLYQYTYTLANKDQTGADFTSVQFNSVLAEETLDLIEQYFGKAKDPRRLLINERNQVIKDYLSNSEINTSVNITPENGIIKLPDNYLHLNSIEYTYYEKKEQVCSKCCCTPCSCTPVPKGFIRKGQSCSPKPKMLKRIAEVTIVNNAQWASLLSDHVSYPDLAHPYGHFIGNNTIEIMPQHIPSVKVRYYRYPKEPRWGFVSIGGNDVYDPNISQHVELPRILLRELAFGILERMGIHTREYWMEQVMQQKIITGQ